MVFVLSCHTPFGALVKVVTIHTEEM